MTLSSSLKNKIVDQIHMTITTIGMSVPDTRAPDSDDNMHPLAWEYWLSKQIADYANIRYDNAKKLATISGLIFDPAEEPRPPGTNEPVYEGDFITIRVKVNNPARRVDAKKMWKYLQDNGVSVELLTKAMETATSSGRGAHEFIASLTE